MVRRPYKQRISFVTRLRIGAVYDVIEQRECNSDKGILRDQIIELSSTHAIKRNAPTLRLIKFIDFESGKIYTFLTHNLKLSAVTIAAIYKGRWQVELFFKAIKQNLKIKAFSGSSRNAVLTQI